jgi:hypothetical protein
VVGTNKTKSLKLERRIEELIYSGVTPSTAISAALKKEGHDISSPKFLNI